MEEYLKWLDDSQWLNLIFLALATFSILISIFLYKKSRKKKSPTYDIRSTNVISDSLKSIGDVQVKFRDEIIDNLTVTKIAFWNAGNDTLNESDQAPTDKLRIELSDDFVILQSEIIFQSEPTNNIILVEEDNLLKLSYDFFDGNQGGIIKLVHTGKKSSDVAIKGTFKGSDKLKKTNTRLSNLGLVLAIGIPFIGKRIESIEEKRFLRKTVPWVLTLTGIIVVLGSLYFKPHTDLFDKILTPLLGGLYFALGLFVIFGTKKLPKGFEIFYDDE